MAKKPQYLVDTPQYAELIAKGQKLIGKCKFLVARAEFLYQQGMTFNVQAQELVRDAQVSGTEVSAMTAKLDALIAQGAKRAKRARARRRGLSRSGARKVKAIRKRITKERREK
jgi:hypothetical protein